MGEPRYTEKEMVMARQEGFQRGARWREKVTTSGSLQPQVAEDVIVREAKKAFPLPRIERPRVVTEAIGMRWRVVNGTLEFSAQGSTWRDAALAPFTWQIDAERAGIWHDLFAHPSEFVDDEG